MAAPAARKLQKATKKSLAEVDRVEVCGSVSKVFFSFSFCYTGHRGGGRLGLQRRLWLHDALCSVRS